MGASYGASVAREAMEGDTALEEIEMEMYMYQCHETHHHRLEHFDYHHGMEELDLG
jgi:hypothetical protein